jgi:hypothetical protein
MYGLGTNGTVNKLREVTLGRVLGGRSGICSGSLHSPLDRLPELRAEGLADAQKAQAETGRHGGGSGRWRRGGGAGILECSMNRIEFAAGDDCLGFNSIGEECGESIWWRRIRISQRRSRRGRQNVAPKLL